MNQPTGTGKLSPGFLIHAIVALAALLTLNYLIAFVVPISVEGIESSYLVFFYHFPSAFLCFLFFLGVFIFSIMYLVTGNPLWDRHARVSGGIGLLACTITVVTGSIWASMAWNIWWDFRDKRLMFAAIMWLTYAGYVVLQTQMTEHETRRRYAAVFGILAFINVPLVKWAIAWFGQVSHPLQFQDMSSDPAIRGTRWFGVLAFLIFYTLVYIWKYRREAVREDIESVLSQARRLEEGAVS